MFIYCLNWKEGHSETAIAALSTGFVRYYPVSPEKAAGYRKELDKRLKGKEESRPDTPLHYLTALTELDAGQVAGIHKALTGAKSVVRLLPSMARLLLGDFEWQILVLRGSMAMYRFYSEQAADVRMDARMAEISTAEAGAYLAEAHLARFFPAIAEKSSSAKPAQHLPDTGPLRWMRPTQMKHFYTLEDLSQQGEVRRNTRTRLNYHVQNRSVIAIEVPDYKTLGLPAARLYPRFQFGPKMEIRPQIQELLQLLPRDVDSLELFDWLMEVTKGQFRENIWLRDFRLRKLHEMATARFGMSGMFTANGVGVGTAAQDDAGRTPADAGVSEGAKAARRSKT